MIVSVINNKGGTGKTTTAVNLAAALSLDGLRVLVVDLDAQGSASLAMGVRWEELRPSVTDLLFHSADPGSLIRRTGVDGVDLITADMSLSGADLMLASIPGRERRLATVLEPVAATYDIVLCDCPPSLSLMAVNALMASDGYIVPVTPEYLALEGLASLMSAVDILKRRMDLPARLLGILFTMTQPHVAVTRDIVALVRSRYGDRVFETEIRRDVKLGEAPAYSQSIFQWAPSSRGADTYRRLAGEIRRRARSAGVSSPAPPDSAAMIPGTTAGVTDGR